jgi:hypothetical protein
MSATFTARVSQALVAAGRTNDAIAEALSLSPCTIERHLSNIHVKLGAEKQGRPMPPPPWLPALTDGTATSSRSFSMKGDPTVKDNRPRPR